jgi:flavin-dependent dehydrogenase
VRDLVVAGGGPVGLATALLAARAGLDVVVREPRTGVVDKACGEGLMPGAVQELARLGVRPHGHPLRGIRYLDGHRTAEADFRDGDGLGVRRTTLHASLLEAALAAGVEVLPGRVTSYEARTDRVLVDGEAARYLVGADGLHSTVRRLAGLAGEPDRRRRHGLRHHVSVTPWSPYVEVHWSEVGEAYVTPVGPDLVGVAVLTAHRLPLADLLPAFPRLGERLRGAPAASDVRGAGPLRQRVVARSRGRVLLVGDAAGYVDALTGEGLALGLAQARTAVDAVAAGDTSGYDAACRRIGRRHVLLTETLLAAARVPAARRRLVPAASRFPALFGAAVHQLARPA